MTQEEFDKTAFRKGDKVRTNKGTFEVLRVDRDDEELPILASSRWFGLDEILEYIPVEVEGKMNVAKEIEIKSMIQQLKSNDYRVQKKTEIWEDC